MVELIVNNVFTEISHVKKETELQIWEKLSFEVKEFNASGFAPPKIRHLYNRKTHLTYTGLIEYVTDLLNEEEVDYKVIDLREKVLPNADFKLVEYLDDEHEIKLQMRDYQEKIVNEASNREIIEVQTGGGKTFIMAALIAKFNVKPVSVFADKLSLCTQLQEEFSKFLGVEVGLVGGGLNNKKDITVYSAQSATEEDVKDTKLMMVDECLPGDARVLTPSGYVMIKDIVDNTIYHVDSVVSYNIETKSFEIKKIINRWKRLIDDRKMMQLYIRKENTRLVLVKCTNNHKVFIANTSEYIRADELSSGLKVITSVNGEPTIGYIEKIKYIDTNEKYVYDIEVEDNHNFITEDLLVSNCHHTPANTIMQISKWCKDAYYRIGVSATPWRDDNSDMLIDSVFNKRHPELAINASYLIERGYLVPCSIYWVNNKQIFKGKNYNKLYTEAIVKNDVRNNKIVTIALNMRKYKKAISLILIQRVEHGEILLNKISKYIKPKYFNIKVKNPKNDKDVLVRVRNVEFLSGTDDAIKRAAVIKAVKERKCEILIASTIADEGLDLPVLDNLILAGGGKSSTRAFQRVGRVLRLYTNPDTGEKKERATVFDFCDYTPTFRRHARVRDKMYHKEPAWDIKLINPALLDNDD